MRHLFRALARPQIHVLEGAPLRDRPFKAHPRAELRYLSILVKNSARARSARLG